MTSRALPWKNISLITVAVLATVIAFNWNKINQLYHVIKLFDEDQIVSNFSQMDALFPTRTLERKGPVQTFNRAPVALPDTYEYKGERRSVEAFLEKSATTALLVLSGDTITYEKYFKGTHGDDFRISWSTAKSMLSALFGIAVQEGHIKNIHEKVTDYVPELKGTGYDDVSIKNVLQMSSGVAFNEDYGDFNSDINRFGRLIALGGSFDEFAASLVNERKQGTYLHYVSIDTHVLGMVIRNATQRDFVEYFNEKIWHKIGAEANGYYIVDSYNEPMVLGGLNIRTRDFARFGKLYLDGGVAMGEQVVPKDWITDSITPDAPHLVPGTRDSSDIALGYGYQWWLPLNADQEFMAIGVYDQFIYVNQKHNMVIVKNSANRHFMDNDFESAMETVEFFRAVVSSQVQGGAALVSQNLH